MQSSREMSSNYINGIEGVPRSPDAKIEIDYKILHEILIPQEACPDKNHAREIIVPK
jgi:hypothetical protein